MKCAAMPRAECAINASLWAMAAPADRSSSAALAVAELTGGHLTEIGAQVAGHLGSAGLWRIDPSDGPRAYGMCGRLTTYPASRAAQVG